MWLEGPCPVAVLAKQLLETKELPESAGCGMAHTQDGAAAAARRKATCKDASMTRSQRMGLSVAGHARRAVSVCLVAALLGGCAQSAANLLNTGSIGGNKPAQAAAPPPPPTPADRALHVAATSARAQKCGYYFDPAKLKSDYLGFEAANGLAADGLAGITRLYDFTQAKIAGTIAADAEYCNSERTAEIKTQLNKYLAGDYAAPPRKAKKPEESFFAFGRPQEKTKINPNWWQKGASPTVKVE